MNLKLLYRIGCHHDDQDVILTRHSAVSLTADGIGR